MEVQTDTNIVDEMKKKQKKKKMLMRDCCKWLGCLHVVENYTLFINVYLFIFTDFIIRTFPLIAIIAIINGNNGKFYASITSILFFGGLCIYEYFANKWIRSDKTRVIKYKKYCFDFYGFCIIIILFIYVIIKYIK